MKLSSLPRYLALLALLASALLWFWPDALNLPTEARQAASLTLATVALWATGSLPEHLVSLGFLLFAMLGQVAPSEVVFAGFQSGALWLVFSGLVIGAAVNRTGLGERLAQRVLALAGTRYGGDYRHGGAGECVAVTTDALHHGAHRAADSGDGGAGHPLGVQGG